MKETGILKKNKGDVTFLLEVDNGIYHCIKMKKVYRKGRAIRKGEPKTTKQVVSDFLFSDDSLEFIDFTANGLALDDKKFILDLVTALKTLQMVSV